MFADHVRLPYEEKLGFEEKALRAIVVEKAGGPEVLQIKEVQRPKPLPGWVLIKVKAFGLNRSEIFTRQGHSPTVRFPRVLGIECVGTVEEAPGSDLTPGQVVAAVMGGMGRQFDGGYAEYTCVPATQVIPVNSGLEWATFGAIPETFLTAWRILGDGLEATAGQSLLVRGGTSSVGMALITLANDMGLSVAATTRNEAKRDALLENGAHHVIIDAGEIATQVREIFPDGVDRLAELVGTVSLLDSLQAVTPKGILCMAGLLGGEWTFKEFSPMEAIPYSVRLTPISTHVLTRENSTEDLQRIVDGIQSGRYRVNLDRVFRFDEIVEAHQYMEENKARGKLVVTVK